MNHKTIPLIEDQHDRDEALNIAQSYIVQAPAGSGKTELISQRYLKLLASSEQPESVLAITFTRKAANEMRLRILNALESADQNKTVQTHQLKTQQLAHEVLKQDRLQQWQLLANPGRLRIVTIDRFNAQLNRQMPLLSKMGIAVAPTKDPRPLYLEAARRTLTELESKEYQNDLSILLPHLSNNIDRIQQLLVTMLSKRDHWLRHLAPSQKTHHRREELEQAFSHYIEEHLQQLHQSLPNGFLSALTEIVCFAASQVDETKQPRIARWSSMQDKQLTATPEQLILWQGLADFLLTQKDEVRISVNKNMGIPAPSSTKDPELKKQHSKRKEETLALLHELRCQPKFIQAFIALRQMPSRKYTDQQWRLVQALSRIMLLSAAYLKIVFSEYHQVDFTEIAESASQALGDEQQPTELAMILDYQLQHILVDEFQDTSQSQLNLLKKLTMGWQSNDGRTLFLVGDPMQSIYRFREAEVGLYLHARRHGIGDIQLNALTLSVNFRSQGNIVKWVNQHLQAIFPQQENISTGAVTYSQSTPFHASLSGQAVTLYAYQERDDEREAKQVTQIIQQHLATDDQSTLAILVRNRSHLKNILHQLKKLGIGFQGIDLDPLKEQPCVIDLYTLTRIFHHYADRLHWLSFLRAPWCGLKLADLNLIANGPHSTIWENCLDQNLLNQLSSDGSERLNRVIEQLSPFLQQHFRMSLRETLEACWKNLGGHVIYPSPNDCEAIQSYLTLIESHQKGGRIEAIDQFNLALDKLYAPIDLLADDRIQIMTIHKAKGLEFDTVILPGLGKSGRHDDAHLLEWLERPNQWGGVDLLMAPIKSSKNDQDDAINQSLKAINKAKANNELTRLLYVALTRSKQRLHLFGHTNIDKKDQPKPAANSLLNVLWPSLSETFEERLSSTPQEIEQSPIKPRDQQSLKRLNTQWQPDIASPLNITIDQETASSDTVQPTLEFDWATETARHIGTVTHRYLEYISTHYTDEWSTSKIDSYQQSIRHNLISLGVATSDISKATLKVLTALKNTITDERGQWILQNHTQAQSEYTLTETTEHGFHRSIIDRTFIDSQGIRWIIDYKTGDHKGDDKAAFMDQEQQRYQHQLNHYAQLMQKMDNHPIQLGLYFPLLQGWRWWTFQPSL